MAASWPPLFCKREAEIAKFEADTCKTNGLEKSTGSREGRAAKVA